MHYFSTAEEAEADAAYDRDLSGLLATIIDKESEIEMQRSLLCENDKFNCSEAFRFLDIHGHGYLSSLDIKQFLSKNHVMTRESEVEFLIYNYATNHQTISFKEFLDIILPKQDDDLKEQCLARRKIPQDIPYLPFYLEEQISRIFEMEIAYIRDTEAQKMDIMNNYGWNYRESFKRIATRGQYHIDKLSFQEFMRKNGYSQLGQQAFQLLLIRFNKDDNLLITMDEFSNAIFPSDFLASASSTHPRSQQQPTSPYLRYVKGDQHQFNEFVTNSAQKQEEAAKFRQSDYEFRNDIDAYNAQKKRQGDLPSRKFLKTSMQYENAMQVDIPQQQEQLEVQKDEKQYPILNKYMTNKFKSPQSGASAAVLAAKSNQSTQQPFSSPSGQKFFSSTAAEENYQTANRGVSTQQKQAQFSSPITYLTSPKNENNQLSANENTRFQQNNVQQQRVPAQQDNFRDNQLKNRQLVSPYMQRQQPQQQNIQNYQDEQSNEYNQYLQTQWEESNLQQYRIQQQQYLQQLPYYPSKQKNPTVFSNNNLNNDALLTQEELANSYVVKSMLGNNSQHPGSLSMPTMNNTLKQNSSGTAQFGQGTANFYSQLQNNNKNNNLPRMQPFSQNDYTKSRMIQP